MRTLAALMGTLLLCAGCAQGGAPGSAASNGSITMYGVIDSGVTIHK